MRLNCGALQTQRRDEILALRQDGSNGSPEQKPQAGHDPGSKPIPCLRIEKIGLNQCAVSRKELHERPFSDAGIIEFKRATEDELLDHTGAHIELSRHIRPNSFGSTRTRRPWRALGEINGIGRLRSNTFTVLAGCYAQRWAESICREHLVSTAPAQRRPASRQRRGPLSSINSSSSLSPRASSIGRFIGTSVWSSRSRYRLGMKRRSPPYRSSEDSVRKNSAGVAIRRPVRFATSRVKCLVLCVSNQSTFLATAERSTGTSAACRMS